MYMISDAHTEGFEVFLDGRRTPEPALGKPDDVNRTGDEELSHFQNFFDAIPRPFLLFRILSDGSAPRKKPGSRKRRPGGRGPEIWESALKTA